MNVISFYIFLVLLISGCATTSKTVQSAGIPSKPAPAVQAKVIPTASPAAEESVKENIAVVPPPIEIQPAVQKASPVSGQGIALQAPLTYPQIINVIGEFLDIKPVEDVAGKRRLLGTSENNLVTMEIIGSDEDVSEVSMRLVYPPDIDTVNADLNNAMMLRFLRNVAPESKDWAEDAKSMLKRFYGIASGGMQEDKIALGQKIIHILYDRNMNAITLTLRRI